MCLAKYTFICENHGEETSRACAAKGSPSLLRGGMSWIIENKQGVVEEYLLTLPVLNIVEDPVLSGVPPIQWEADDILKCILHVK